MSASVVRLVDSQIELAADVLVRAFFDDPLSVYIFPDPEEREDLLFWHYGTLIQYGLSSGEVFTTAECDAVAIWLCQGDDLGSSVDGLRQAGISDAPDVLGKESFRRFASVADHLVRVRKRNVAPSHWYLPVLGVHPGQQGHGLGTALLATGLARAESTGLPCYLETFQPHNIPFYRENKLDLIVEDTEPSSGLTFWSFCRYQKG